MAEQRIRRCKLVDLLAVLLEDILPVMGLLQEFRNVDLAFHEGLDKCEHNIKPIATVRPQRPNKGFQNVAQFLGIRATMNGRRLLIMPRNHLKLRQTDLLGKLPETLVVDEFLTEICEEPLLLIRIALAKLSGNADTQHGIPLELQTFLRIVEQIHHARWARSELRRLPIRSSLFCTTNLRRVNHRLLKDLGTLHTLRRQSMCLENLANILIAKRPILAILGYVELHDLLSGVTLKCRTWLRSLPQLGHRICRQRTRVSETFSSKLHRVRGLREPLGRFRRFTGLACWRTFSKLGRDRIIKQPSFGM